ncbi:MAG: lipid-A-disaccharide synthase, partial [Candidatus Omnitrophica bacterium]|nr:lipid-A-disaccharide synthase [Candidatus Omnitrophota bacterium]
MAKNIEDIFIVCGEPSGDLLAGNLLEEIRRINPQVKCCGVGGKRLADAGAEIIYDIKELSVMGLLDVLKKLPRFLKLKNLILKEIDARKPSCLILIDFSGFNLRLAAAVNKRIPVIYYVSPQIWASREKRVKRIKKFISLNIVLFRFEEEFYKKHGLRVERVGHPLLDLVKPSPDKKGLCAETGITPGKPIVSLLPGSRKQELRLILPLMLESALIINKKNPGTQFIIAKSPALEAKEYSRICASYGNLDLKIIEGRTADCLDLAQASLVCSGTAALEAAI